jgi:phosphate transport system protein
MEEIRKTFAQEISDLKQSVVDIGEMSIDLIANAIKALVDRNTDLAEEVIQADEKVDDKSIEIEEKCLKLLALQQPMAIDLRLISGVWKINTDIERLTDHTTKIARKAKILSSLKQIKPYDDLPKMAQRAIEMFRLSLGAFITLDSDLAEKIIGMDDEIDDYNHKIFVELVSIMNRDASSIDYVSHLMSVVASIERIGDHVTNICERIIFIKTGTLPKSD